jgi:hypothetical protein
MKMTFKKGNKDDLQHIQEKQLKNALPEVFL